MRPQTTFSKSQLEQHLFSAYNEKPKARNFPAYETSQAAHDLAMELKHQIHSLLESAFLLDPSISPRMRHHLFKEEMTHLRIEIYDEPDLVRKIISNFGYAKATGQIHTDESLIVLKLPKPINFFYWKGSDKKQQTPTIRWGELYDRVIDQIWRVRDAFIANAPVNIERINPPYVHDADNYYYLWLVSPKGRAPIETDTPEA